jgi:putative DNA primase/helicase
VSGPAWASLLDHTERGAIRSTLANAVTVLQHDPSWGPETLYYDEFQDRVLLVNSPTREWRDDDDTKLTVYMQQDVGMRSVPESQDATALRDIWGVQPTDAQPLEYIEAVSANFFIGLIARVMKPGCQLDTMLILEGAQGIGKSRSLRILGGDWYMLAAESVASKDFYQALPGKWLIEIGELDAMSKADRERTKIAISTPTDRYRSSYGRRAVDHPRQCLFVGTTNRTDYGNDDTGLRRLWPVMCGAIDTDALIAAKAQLFAEAYAAFQDGATWWETPGSTLDVQRDRQHEDAWTATVLDWLTMKDETTSTDVLTNSPLKFQEGNIGRGEQGRISSILTLNGWRRQTIRWNGRPVKGFRRVVTDDEGLQPK